MTTTDTSPEAPDLTSPASRFPVAGARPGHEDAVPPDRAGRPGKKAKT